MQRLSFFLVQPAEERSVSLLSFESNETDETPKDLRLTERSVGGHHYFSLYEDSLLMDVSINGPKIGKAASDSTSKDRRFEPRLRQEHKKHV